MDSGMDAGQDSGWDAGPGLPAWFVIDSARIGNANEGCNLNTTPGVDNRIGLLANWLVNLGLIDEDINQALADAITSGDSLAVVAINNADNFDNDPAVILTFHEGELVPPPDGGVPDAGSDTGVSDAGVMDEVFSGHGRLIVKDPPHSTIPGSSIVNRVISTPSSQIVVSIVLDDAPVDITLDKARLFATENPPPDAERLNGRLTYGLICGAVANDTLGDLIENALGIPYNAALRTFIAGNADVDGNTKTSFGLPFTAVSVERANP